MQKKTLKRFKKSCQHVQNQFHYQPSPSDIHHLSLPVYFSSTLLVLIWHIYIHIYIYIYIYIYICMLFDKISLDISVIFFFSFFIMVSHSIIVLTKSDMVNNDWLKILPNSCLIATSHVRIFIKIIIIDYLYHNCYLSHHLYNTENPYSQLLCVCKLSHLLLSFSCSSPTYILGIKRKKRNRFYFYISTILSFSAIQQENWAKKLKCYYYSVIVFKVTNKNWKTLRVQDL